MRNVVFSLKGGRDGVKAAANATRWLSLFLLLLTVVPLGSALAQEKVGAKSDFSLDAMKEELAAGKAILIDVREDNEWNAGHLKAAEKLPLSDLRTRSSFVDLNLKYPKDKTLYLHCQVGQRCQTAAKILAEKGWKTVAVPTAYPALIASGFEVDKSVYEGINKDFKNPDLSVEEYLSKFEVESREVYSSRKEILKAIDLKEGQAVIDLGAGTGFYTFLFADEVGPEGSVLALDIAPKFVESIQQKAKDDKRSNVMAALSSDTGFDVLPESIDLIFVCDVYHHFEYPERMLASIKQALAEGGRLVIIDFKREEGVSREWVLSHVRAGQDVVRKEVEGAGLKFVSANTEMLDENYLMIFEKE